MLVIGSTAVIAVLAIGTPIILFFFFAVFREAARRVLTIPQRAYTNIADFMHNRALRKLEIAAAEEKLRNEQIQSLWIHKKQDK